MFPERGPKRRVCDRRGFPSSKGAGRLPISIKKKRKKKKKRSERDKELRRVDPSEKGKRRVLMIRRNEAAHPKGLRTVTGGTDRRRKKKKERNSPGDSKYVPG